jgi:ABC-2 type transport system ATP-binding protein
MRRRLDLAAAMLAGPPVLFLDEPTTGLDPAARLELWQAVRDLVAEGTSVLLTTQYLEEADQLADNIAVLAGGQVIAEGTSEQLKRRFGGQRLEITTARTGQLAAARAVLARITGTEPAVEPGAARVSVAIEVSAPRIAAAATELAAAGIDLSGFAIRQPTLDEVFFNLTGRRGSGARAPEGIAA